MLELDYSTRLEGLVNSVYARLASLGSKLNSRIPGNPLPTVIRACSTMIADAWEDVIGLLQAYNPLTSKGAAQKQVLGIFGLTPLEATRGIQTFTLMRTSAADPKVVSAGATIQTKRMTNGRVLSFKLVGDGFTMPVNTYFWTAEFQAIEVGLQSTLTAIQEMELASGSTGLLAASGAYNGAEANPLASMTSTGFSAWLASNTGDFALLTSVQGRDLETDEEYFQRCISRWDEETTGSTAGAYEAWARGYVDPVTGDSPVLAARVTENQVYASTSTWPAGQDPTPVNGTTYTMGVELAVALRSGLMPEPELLDLIGQSILPLKPHTDKVWLRGPFMVDMTAAGSVQITMRGPSKFQAQAREIVASFFIYNELLKDNYRGLGQTVYLSDVIHAIRSISPLILDVKVEFTPPVLVPSRLGADGDLELLAFDQVSMTNPATSIAISVV